MTVTYVADNIDYRLAFHCAPVLAGLKPANLLSLSKRDGDAAGEVAGCVARLGDMDLRVYTLLDSERHLLLLVYSEQRLGQCLDQRASRGFLRRFGYHAGMDLWEMLAHLAQRLRGGGGEYPHEIGVFLGYPLRDIVGFIRNKGDSCKLCGYWKVYGDEDGARNLFKAYDAARSFYCQRVLRGEDIHTIQYGGYCT